jgi:hypothetical protein
MSLSTRLGAPGTTGHTTSAVYRNFLKEVRARWIRAGSRILPLPCCCRVSAYARSAIRSKGHARSNPATPFRTFFLALSICWRSSDGLVLRSLFRADLISLVSRLSRNPRSRANAGIRDSSCLHSTSITCTSRSASSWSRCRLSTRLTFLTPDWSGRSRSRSVTARSRRVATRRS